MSPDQYCHSKAVTSGSSFYHSFWLLPTVGRRAIMALYAFCREVDDIVDECHEPAIAAIKLSWWRQEITSIDNGKPQHPVCIALHAASQHFRLRPELLLEVIDGMEMDLRHNRYADFNKLRLYCYRVAAVVGQLSAEIFGYRNRETLKYAHDLGLAFQLTNIIRDVGEDARRGRIYIPQDELARFGVSETEIIACNYTDNFRALMQFQYERASTFYQKALSRLPKEDCRAQQPGLSMAAVYRTLLEEIRHSDYAVLHQRLSLPPARKAWLAFKSWLKPCP